ncbi:MAG TPA: cadherin-like beta sandwich domain-containing protein [Mucilaginibacter sp.]
MIFTVSKKVLLLIFVVFVIILVNNENVYAQNPPVITYSTPQLYTAGSAITPLSPTNTGGSVYPANYTTPATFNPYNAPFSIAIDGSNNVYTTNNTTGDLTKYNAAGTALFTLNTGNAMASEVAVDGLGNIYVSQFTTNSVLKYSPNGALLATISGFSDPYGIAFDGSNNAYVANRFTGNILEIKAGATVATTYLTGFTTPYGIILDASGNLYVGEQGQGDIIKVAAGTLTRTTFASGFNGPRHLNKDAFGNIYVADFGNNAIKRISPTGKITAVISTGLNFPRQAAFDSSGNLFIANYGTNILLKSVGTSYSIDTPLPAGLSFNTSNGQITGTPTAPLAATVFNITAYNTGGSSSTPLTITIGTQLLQTETTLAVSSITATTATLNGIVNNNGSSVLVSFTYGTDPNLINGTTTLATTNSTLNVGNTSNSALTVTGLKSLTTYYYRITAADSSGTKAGNIVSFVTVPSSNASLSNLSVSSGILSPAFASGTGNYTASVANNISSIKLTPVTNDSTATVTVNGMKVASGSASAGQPLNVGNNTITTTVTAQNGTTTQSYTLTVTRAASSNANLTALNTDTGTMSPVFSSTVLSYNLSVDNSTSSIALSPVASDPNATLTINGTLLASGASALLIPLAVGDNTITTVVTATNGTTTHSYTVIVYRQKPVLAISSPIGPSSDANLANLTLSSGNLNPVFASGTTSYTANVSNATTSITISPTTIDNTATLTVNGAQLASGASSAPIALAVGNNTITTVVTAQDGTTKMTYTVVVTRAKSSNANLADLAVGSGTLNPGFATGTNNYTDTVSNSTTSIQIRATTSDKTATLTVNGINLLSGTISAPINLTAGNNIITIMVTAQDGITTDKYILTVFRTPSSNANLSNLSLSSGSLSPLFASGTVSYTASVANTISSITIDPKTSDVNATLTINGAKLSFGATWWPVALAVGNNTITTVVTAQDGKTTKIYTVTVFRAPSSNANLSNLMVSGASLSPVFASATTSYKTSVSSPSVTITPVVSDTTAIAAVNGIALPPGTTSGPIALKVGNNTINIIVTAQDGKTTMAYTLTVKRSSEQSNANLASLTISSGTLSPAFATNTTYYTASVGQVTSSIKVTAATSNANATLTVNGIPVTSGSASGPIGLNMGANTISLLVTSADGKTTMSYTVSVTRQAISSIATLSNLTISSGHLSPAFATGTNSYVDTVSYTDTTVMVTPTLSDSTATVTVNGTLVPSGSASVSQPLIVGNNAITTVVMAQDGKTTDTYTITVIRSSNDLNLTLVSSSSRTGISGKSNMNFARMTGNPGNGPKSVLSVNAGVRDESTDKILVHQAVSPNGDGINDFLLIEGIENYPGNKVAIINRDGTAVYNVNGYNNFDKVFDGHSNISGRLQQPGTYFYMIEYSVDGQLRRKTGYFILKF